MTARCFFLLASLSALACGTPGGSDAGTLDGGRDAATVPDAGPDARVEPPGVAVSHEREVRGVWIATVFNINWPSRAGLDAATQRAELDVLLDAALAAGANAVFFQVRAEADAFYASELEPWSRFLTGTMGTDPGYDPLRYAIDAAHARGLELHAWMNPYRALASADASLASSTHVSNARPDLVRAYASFRWIDPGSDGGLAHTLAVIRDVLSRYDIDGLHFDDYFYPYPESGVTFDDAATYAAYRSAGGALDRDDWRRDNVHRMVRAVHDAVAELRPDVRFGISPFGIYRPGMPAGITGLDQYASLYADPLVWMREGWIDYLAPQLYWPTTQTAQAYGTLLDWWAARAVETNRTLLVGNYLEQLGSSGAWTLAEIRAQMDLTRAARDRSTYGNIHYHVAPLVENRGGITSALRADYYAQPAATPPLVDATGPSPPAPRPTVDGAEAVLAPDDTLRFFAAYESTDAGWRLRVLSPASSARVTLWRGSWAISAIDRRSVESLGVPIEIAEGDPPDPPAPPTGAPCTHSLGGRYADTACSAGYQCCDGSWQMRDAPGCGACRCVEPTGNVGCGL